MQDLASWITALKLSKAVVPLSKRWSLIRSLVLTPKSWKTFLKELAKTLRKTVIRELSLCGQRSARMKRWHMCFLHYEAATLESSISFLGRLRSWVRFRTARCTLSTIQTHWFSSLTTWNSCVSILPRFQSRVKDPSQMMSRIEMSNLRDSQRSRRRWANTKTAQIKTARQKSSLPNSNSTTSRKKSAHLMSSSRRTSKYFRMRVQSRLKFLKQSHPLNPLNRLKPLPTQFRKTWLRDLRQLQPMIWSAHSPSNHFWKMKCKSSTWVSRSARSQSNKMTRHTTITEDPRRALSASSISRSLNSNLMTSRWRVILRSWQEKQMTWSISLWSTRWSSQIQVCCLQKWDQRTNLISCSTKSGQMTRCYMNLRPSWKAKNTT